MSEYHALVKWTRGENEAFTDNKYSRGHEWQFDGGLTVPASSSPDVVPLPYSVAANLDPEEAFVASLSSCHMLFFLAFMVKNKYLVESYTDEAYGILEKNDAGKIAMTKVVLRPKVVFGGDQAPSYEKLVELHHKAHEHCYIANSVSAEVITEIQS